MYVLIDANDLGNWKISETRMTTLEVREADVWKDFIVKIEMS